MPRQAALELRYCAMPIIMAVMSSWRLTEPQTRPRVTETETDSDVMAAYRRDKRIRLTDAYRHVGVLRPIASDKESVFAELMALATKYVNSSALFTPNYGIKSKVYDTNII